MLKRLAAILILGIWLAACASTASRTLISTGDRYAVQAAEEANYQLGIGDRIKLTVFNEESLSGEFNVSANGALSFPLVGDVPAVGKTPDEIGQAVRTRLADGYLREPRISIEMVKYRPFFILGEVKAPGQYPYVSGLTVFNAVATAEGFSPRADKKVAYIRSPGSTTEEAYRLTPDLRIRPGDTIRIGERYF